MKIPNPVGNIGKRSKSDLVLGIAVGYPFPSFKITLDPSLNLILAIPELIALKVMEETKPAEVLIPPKIPPRKLIVPCVLREKGTKMRNPPARQKNWTTQEKIGLKL